MVLGWLATPRAAFNACEPRLCVDAPPRAPTLRDAARSHITRPCRRRSPRPRFSVSVVPCCGNRARAPAPRRALHCARRLHLVSGDARGAPPRRGYLPLGARGHRPLRTPVMLDPLPLDTLLADELVEPVGATRRAVGTARPCTPSRVRSPSSAASCGHGPVFACRPRDPRNNGPPTLSSRVLLARSGMTGTHIRPKSRLRSRMSWGTSSPV